MYLLGELTRGKQTRVISSFRLLLTATNPGGGFQCREPFGLHVSANSQGDVSPLLHYLCGLRR